MLWWPASRPCPTRAKDYHQSGMYQSRVERKMTIYNIEKTDNHYWDPRFRNFFRPRPSTTDENPLYPEERRLLIQILVDLIKVHLNLVCQLLTYRVYRPHLTMSEKFRMGQKKFTKGPKRQEKRLKTLWPICLHNQWIRYKPNLTSITKLEDLWLFLSQRKDTERVLHIYESNHCRSPLRAIENVINVQPKTILNQNTKLGR